MKDIFLTLAAGTPMKCSLRQFIAILRNSVLQNSFEAKIINHIRHTILSDRQARYLRMTGMILLYVLMSCIVKITWRLA
jgi:hypothetical protein